MCVVGLFHPLPPSPYLATTAVPVQTISLVLSLGVATYTDESSALCTALCTEAGLPPGASSPEDAERVLCLMMKNKPERVKALLREQGCLDLTSRLMVAELDELAARLGVVEDKMEVVEDKVEMVEGNLQPLNYAL